MSKKYLLGATSDREIVFAEFEATHPRYWSKENGNYTDESVRHFSASFDCVIPFTEDDLEDAEDYYRDLVDECYDDGEKYKMCERYDCKPSELAEYLAEDEGTDPQNIRDCSLYSNIIEVDGIDYYFESGSCGQHDTRKDGMDEYVNKEAYDLLHELWDKYHLKTIDEDGLKKMQRVTELLEDVDEEEWIADYIRRNF